jgi:hypothetical protein
MKALSSPSTVDTGSLSPAETKLHFITKEINHLRQVLELKELSIARKNIRMHEVTLLNADIRELNDRIAILETEAEEFALLV